MSRIFVSYSRQDGPAVTRIANRLKEAGHKVWLDKSTIQGGARWQEEIVRGIEKADVFVLMLSPDAVQSKHIEREIGLAYTTSKTIMPVMLRRTESPAHVEYAISGLDMIDISNENAESASQRILAALASPDARIRGVALGAWSRSDRVLLPTLALAIFIVSSQDSWGGRWHWGILAVLAAPVVWIMGARRVFWELFRRALSRRLSRRSVVLSTRLKGFGGGGFAGRIVSEWSDPKSGKRYEFYSRGLWWDPMGFVPKEIRVIVDPENFRLYQMDLSFLPRRAGGVLKPHGKDDRTSVQRGAGHIFVSHTGGNNHAVNVLLSDLEVAGYAVRTPKEPGQDEADSQQVIHDIKNAQLFLIVLSEDSAVMEQAQRELDLAMSYGKPMMAAVLGPSHASAQMNYALAGVQWFDLSENLHAGITRLLAAIAGEAPQGTVIYKPARFSFLPKLLFRAGQMISVMLCLPIYGSPLKWLWKHLPSGYRSTLLSRAAMVKTRLGIWTDHDLRTRGTALLTDFKGLESGAVISQWRDPVSHDLYRFRSGSFRSDTLTIDPAQLSGVRTITVYVNPANLCRYCMDLSFLPKKQTNQRALKSGMPSQSRDVNIAGDGIFLSYSEQDAEKAIAMARQLKVEGFLVIESAGLPGGVSSEQAKKMMDCVHTVVLVIPSDNASDFRARIEELRLACACSKHIIPISFSRQSAMPPAMQYALAGINLINLGDDLEDGAAKLLKALGRFVDAEQQADSGVETGPYPVRTRFTGAWIGALCFSIGSMLPAFLVHGRSRMSEALVGGAIAGMVCGSIVGTIVRPRSKKVKVAALGIFVVLFGGVLIYFPAYFLVDRFFKAEDVNGTIRGEALVAALVGYLAWVAGKMSEDRLLVHRLKTRGKLLLTEYRRFTGTEVVSEWRDPTTDEVHVFCGEIRDRDPSKLIRTTTIRVFVNPENLDDYYMDLPSNPSGRRP